MPPSRFCVIAELGEAISLKNSWLSVHICRDQLMTSYQLQQLTRLRRLGWNRELLD